MKNDNITSLKCFCRCRERESNLLGTVYGHTGGFTGGVKTGNDLVVSVLVNSQDFTSVLGGDTTHVVMDGW